MNIRKEFLELVVSTLEDLMDKTEIPGEKVLMCSLVYALEKILKKMKVDK